MRLLTCFQIFCSMLVLSLVAGCGGQSDEGPSLSAERARIAIQVGKQIFSDASLHNPPVLSCANCHNPASGWADPRGQATSEGSATGFVGKRNAPSIAYSRYSPRLRETTVDGKALYVGGLFADGRVDLLEVVGRKPINNHLSAYAVADSYVAQAVQNSGYADDFLRAFGHDGFEAPDHTREHLGDAVAAFMMSDEISRFSSRFDRHLAGNSDFTEQEKAGFALFTDADKGDCASCHSVANDALALRPLLTNHGYYNIGIPRNLNSQWLQMPTTINAAGPDFIDEGLRRSTGREEHKGLFRTPTLRNVAVTAPYGHNGYFATLEDIVNFHNVKNSGAFPAAEVPATENTVDIGALGLSSDEEAAIVAFLRTLTDL